MAKPEIGPAEQWQHARDELLKAEKEATRALDALAARRHRLPTVKFGDSYAFDTHRPHDAGRPVRGPRPARRLPVHGPRARQVLSRLHGVHQQRHRPIADYSRSAMDLSDS